MMRVGELESAASVSVSESDSLDPYETLGLLWGGKSSTINAFSQEPYYFPKIKKDFNFKRM